MVMQTQPRRAPFQSICSSHCIALLLLYIQVQWMDSDENYTMQGEATRCMLALVQMGIISFYLGRITDVNFVFHADADYGV